MNKPERRAPQKRVPGVGNEREMLGRKVTVKQSKEN